MNPASSMRTGPLLGHAWHALDAAEVLAHLRTDPDAGRTAEEARARLERDARLTRIASAELVHGDLIVLEAGSQVPADARLIRGAALRVAEDARELIDVDYEPLPLAQALAPAPRVARLELRIGRGGGQPMETVG